MVDKSEGYVVACACTRDEDAGVCYVSHTYGCGLGVAATLGGSVGYTTFG